MSLRHAIESLAFRSLLTLARVTPRRLLLGLGTRAGDLGYLLNARHRKIALDNVHQALGPELAPAEARRIVRESWRHFGRITMDSLNFSRFTADCVGELVHYEGLEHIRSAYAEGRGVLLFSAHFGHWELTALMQGHMGLPLSLVARPLDNPDLERMLAELRGMSGNRVIHKRSAVRDILRTLRDGGGIAIVIDQDARRRGVFVPFFGRPASTTPTLALAAIRTGAVVIPTYSLPRADGSYTVVYEAPVAVRISEDRDADVLKLTAECTARIEGWIRAHPELWLWMHRRWKSQPPSAADEPLTPSSDVGQKV